MTGPWLLSAVLLVPGLIAGQPSDDPVPTGQGEEVTARPAPGAQAAEADTEAPLVTCAAPDGEWHASNVALRCTASDDGGLARAGNASFELRTAVKAGAESATAATSTRQVCDVAGNCTTAGPIGGNRVDRKAPDIDVRVPADGGRYGLFTAHDVGYGCVDVGAGVLDCKGDQAAGSRLKTGLSTLGPRGFTIVAVDKVGNKRRVSPQYTVEPLVLPAADPPSGAGTGPGGRPG